MPVFEYARKASMSDIQVHVIDYGIGNIGSIINMFRRIGVVAKRSSDPDALRRAQRLVLPGVGAFDRAMNQLREHALDQAVTEMVVGGGKPILGICLGMQLLADFSEEGVEKGLGWIPGAVRALKFDNPRVRVPHMGWAYVDIARSHAMLRGIEEKQRFYFAHSYHFIPADPDDALLTTDYGGQKLIVAVQRDNILGMQFHPEKSHRYGMSMLKRFVRWAH